MTLFFTIALVQLIALASPGPDFFFISQTAASRSRRETLASVAGIVLGVALWAALALLGLQLLFQRLHWLQQSMVVAGGLYLSWLGIKMLRAAGRKSALPASPVPAQLAPRGVWRSLIVGLGTNLANPKVLVYFGSIFSSFTGDHLSSATRCGLWILIVLETLGWFVLVTAVFSLPAMRRGYLQLGRWIDGVAGVVFVGFGLHLLFNRRSF